MIALLCPMVFAALVGFLLGFMVGIAYHQGLGRRL